GSRSACVRATVATRTPCTSKSRVIAPPRLRAPSTTAVPGVSLDMAAADRTQTEPDDGTQADRDDQRRERPCEPRLRRHHEHDSEREAGVRPRGDACEVLAGEVREACARLALGGLSELVS